MTISFFRFLLFVVAVVVVSFQSERIEVRGGGNNELLASSLNRARTAQPSCRVLRQVTDEFLLIFFSSACYRVYHFSNNRCGFVTGGDWESIV